MLIFGNLVRKIDPFFEMTGKIEDEIPAFFKQLGYPYSISKNSLLAVGAPNSWPSLLACLHWLLDVVKMNDFSTDNQDNIILTKDNTEQELYSGQLLKAYELFLKSEDYNEELCELSFLLQSKFKDLKDRYMQISEIVDNLKNERDELKHNWQNIENIESRIDMSRSQTNSLKNTNHLIVTIQDLEDKKNHLLHVFREKRDLFDDLELKNKELYEQLKMQKISLDEKKRMEQELESLETSIFQLEEQREKLRENNWKSQGRIDALISEIYKQLNKYENFSINNAFISTTSPMVSFYPENIKTDIQRVLVPENFLEELRNHESLSAYKRNEGINNYEQEIYKTGQENHQLKIELEEESRVINENIRKINELKRSLKTNPDSINYEIENKTAELRDLEEMIKNCKNLTNELRRDLRIQVESYEMRKKELTKAEADWGNLIKTKTDEILQAVMIANWINDRVHNYIKSTEEFMHKQWSEIGNLYP